MAEATAPLEERTLADRLLGSIERMGNKVPHPVLMFLYLIIIVVVASHVLYLFDVSATDTIAVPAPIEVIPDYLDSTEAIIEPEPEDVDLGDGEWVIEEVTIPIESLLTTEGIRFIFTSFVANFAGFGVVAVTFVALMGAGVAEAAGLMGALIRLLVSASPRWMLSFILIFVGVLSSVASDAGYLILIPLGAAAFLSIGRHPLAGMAACFAGVGAIFGVNPLLGPIDAMITEVTNEALVLANAEPITIVANYWFSVVCSVLLALVAVIVTERVIEPHLGKYEGTATQSADDAPALDPAAESRGLRWALFAFLGVLTLILVLTLPEGSALRDPETGDIIGNTPFMDSLLFIIAMLFLTAGIGFGFGAGTFKGSGDVIAAVTKTFAGMAGLVFMLLMISQFIAFFNYTNMPNVLAIALAASLETSGIGALPLLVGMIVVILLLDILMPNLIPKWAIFAPILVPLFVQLGVPPQTMLAAYRVGDSPMNVVTPLMVYLPFIVTIAQRYDENAGIGTVIALMLPYVIAIAAVWILIFIVWFLLGIPLGPGYPVTT